MAEMIKCPLCGEEIGTLTLEAVQRSPLGPIGHYTQRLNWRKASHVYWYSPRVGGTGNLCKPCARQKYPEGQYYRVAFYYHGKKTYTCAENGDKYYTRAKADEVAENQTRKTGNHYWVESFKAY